MTITSVGYDGSVDEIGWAQLAGLLGADYAVLGPTDWQVTAVAGQDRTVAVALGTGYGHGVLDTTDAQETIQLPTIASGSRWDLVARRRDWQPVGGATTLVSIQGTSSQQIPAGRLSDPGVLDDQPLALVQVTAGQTLPTSIIDLRSWPSKEATAASLLALPNPRLGSVVNIAGKRWRRSLDSQGNPAWADDVARGSLTLPTGWGAFTTPTAPAWSMTPDGLVTLSGQILRTGATFTALNLQEYEIADAIPEQIRPPVSRYEAAVSLTSLLEGIYNGANHKLFFRTRGDQTVTSGAWWICLDGITWRV